MFPNPLLLSDLPQLIYAAYIQNTIYFHYVDTKVLAKSGVNPPATPCDDPKVCWIMQELILIYLLLFFVYEFIPFMSNLVACVRVI